MPHFFCLIGNRNLEALARFTLRNRWQVLAEKFKSQFGRLDRLILSFHCFMRIDEVSAEKLGPRTPYAVAVRSSCRSPQMLNSQKMFSAYLLDISVADCAAFQSCKHSPQMLNSQKKFGTFFQNKSIADCGIARSCNHSLQMQKFEKMVNTFFQDRSIADCGTARSCNHSL